MLYLYHATYQSNLDSIMSQGLLARPTQCNWGGFGGDLCLALDAGVAMAYAENSNYYEDNSDDEIVLFRVPYDKLDSNALTYDERVEAYVPEEIDSCSYACNIPACDLELVSNPNAEPFQDIYSFEGTKLYDVLMGYYGFEE